MESQNDTQTTTRSLVRISTDLINDLLHSFPECEDELMDMKSHLEDSSYLDYCKKIYPQRFFDILYQNDEIFGNDEVDTCFMPNIDFKEYLL